MGRSVNNLRQATFFMLFSAFQCIFATFYVFFNGSGKELFLKAGRSRPVALKKSSFPRNNAAGSRHGFVATTQNRASKEKYQRVRTPGRQQCAPLAFPTHCFGKKSRSNLDPGRVFFFTVFEPILDHFLTRFWMIWGSIFEHFLARFWGFWVCNFDDFEGSILTFSGAQFNDFSGANLVIFRRPIRRFFPPHFGVCRGRSQGQFTIEISKKSWKFWIAIRTILSEQFE